MADLPAENLIFDAVWSIVTRRISERAAATVDMLDDLLHGLGPIARRDHELVAGDRVLNDDRQMLPRVSRATGLGLAVYLGNRRIAAFSSLDSGDAPEPGGYADAVIVETVLRKREPYRGTIERAGRQVVLACRPLFASNKPEDYGPIGMLEAFQDQDTFREMLSSGLRRELDADVRGATERQADRMETVMHFIDDVARRLQLLALNGNIIAAQAGDHGRAFRVVCRELSSLADQSKEAVAEVRRLTDDIAAEEGADEPDNGFGDEEFEVDGGADFDPGETAPPEAPREMLRAEAATGEPDEVPASERITTGLETDATTRSRD